MLIMQEQITEKGSAEKMIASHENVQPKQLQPENELTETLVRPAQSLEQRIEELEKAMNYLARQESGLNINDLAELRQAALNVLRSLE